MLKDIRYRLWVAATVLFSWKKGFYFTSFGKKRITARVNVSLGNLKEVAIDSVDIIEQEISKEYDPDKPANIV